MGQVNELKEFTRGQIDAALMRIGDDVDMGTAEAIKAFLRGELVVKHVDLTIHVDRTKRPFYGGKTFGIARFDSPSSECWGPDSYDLLSLEQWDHMGAGDVPLLEIYQEHKSEDLMSCLNLQDALAIQAKGVPAFRRAFKLHKTVYFFGSVVEDTHGVLYVPCLYYADRKIHLAWDRLNVDWDAAKHIVVRRRKQ